MSCVKVTHKMPKILPFHLEKNAREYLKLLRQWNTNLGQSNENVPPITNIPANATMEWYAIRIATDPEFCKGIFTKKYTIEGENARAYFTRMRAWYIHFKNKEMTFPEPTSIPANITLGDYRQSIVAEVRIGIWV
jgi:hypothetical protein